MFVYEGKEQVKCSLSYVWDSSVIKIKRCYLTSVQKASLGGSCNVYDPLKIQPPPRVLSNTFSVYISLSDLPTRFSNHSNLSLPQENLHRLHTKTCVPVLSSSLLSHGRPFLCSPLHTTFDYSVRRPFVASEGRSCSHGNVLGVWGGCSWIHQGKTHYFSAA